MWTKSPTFLRAKTAGRKMKLELKLVESKQDGWQKTFDVLWLDKPRWEVAPYRLCKVETAMAHCCGANALTMVSNEFLLNKDIAQTVLDFLGTCNFEEKHPWRVKDLFYFCSAHRSYPFLSFPKVTRVHTYPSRSEPGHDIAVYHIKL